MKIVNVVIGLMLMGSLSAQSGMIEGNVMQIDSVNSLPGVSVYLENINLGSATNANGNYFIKNVPVGNYTLVLSAIGYHTIKKEIVVVEGETVRGNFVMLESVSTLSEVVIMTGGNTGIKDIPGSVYYVSPKEVQKFSYTDINRTLRTVPGVNIQEEDGFGLRPNIGLRGTGVERSSKITVMEDGILMAPAPYSAPAAYYFPTIGRMQGIEILKGSSQIKYGPYTTGGAINLVSTQIPNEFGGRINLLGGSFGNRNLHAFVGNTGKNIAYMVETFQYNSDGFKQLDGGGNTGFDKGDYLAKFRINTNDSAKVYQSLTFKVGQATETSNQTYLGLTQVDFNDNPYRQYAGSQVDEMNTKQTQFSISHFIKISKSINVTTTAYRSDFTRNWYKLDKIKDSTGTKTKIGDVLSNPSDYNDAYAIITGGTSVLDDALFVKANNRSYYGKGVQTVLGFNFKTKEISHDIDVGIRVHQDQIDRFQWVDEFAMNEGVMELTSKGIAGTESNRVETADAIASYIQYKVRYRKITITPGLRHENIILNRKDYGKNDVERTGIDLNERSNTVDVYIPGVGLDYQFNDYASIFGGVHKGFAPPGSKEGTRPEESVNYELGFRYTKNSLSGQLVVFLNDYSNLLGSDLAAAGGAGTGDLFNGGEVMTKGLEFQLTYDLLTRISKSKFNLPLSIAYTFTDAKFQNNFESDFGGWGVVEAGDQFPYMAMNQLSAAITLEHRKFSINISGRYISEMRTTPGQSADVNNESIPSNFILDASASYTLDRNISLFTSITNFTNKAYLVSRWPSGLRPGMPRALNIGLKASF